MSKLQVFREFLRERLRTGALEIFGAIEKHFAEYEEDIYRIKEECARLQRLLDIVTQPDIKLHRTDVQQFSLLEPPQDKEELWTNQEEEQLQGLLTDTTNSIFTKESEMSKPQEFEEFHKEILTKAASEIFGAVEKTFADYEEKICQTKEESARLQRLLDILTQPEVKLHRADVQLFSYPEPPQIKEELWTNQEEEQLQGLQSDPTDSIFSSPSVKNHCDQDSYELPHLDQTVKVESSEDDTLTTNTTEEQIKAEPDEKDCGAPEPARDSTPLSAVTPDCPTAQSLEEESGGRLPVLQQTTELKSPNDDLINLKKKHRGRKPNQCKECHKTLSFKSKLIQHMRTHTGDKPYKCQVCSKTYKRKAHVVEHMRTHTGEKPFQCQVCSKTYRQKHYLLQHMRTHTGEKPYQCQVCSKTLTCKSNLVEHMRTHTGEKPFQCQECKQCFSFRSSLTAHMRRHTGDKPYQCMKCSKTFMYEGSYKYHVVSAHLEEKPYQCQECKKCFSVESSLNKHMRKHTGEKPYQCPECDRGFQFKSERLIHMKIHTGEKPFQCQECKATFRQLHHLSQHMTRHSGEKPFQCRECDKCFSRHTGLVQHMTSHTVEKPHQCQECNKSFSRQCTLVKHMWSHTPLTI